MVETRARTHAAPAAYRDAFSFLAWILTGVNLRLMTLISRMPSCHSKGKNLREREGRAGDLIARIAGEDAASAGCRDALRWQKLRIYERGGGGRFCKREDTLEYLLFTKKRKKKTETL